MKIHNGLSAALLIACCSIFGGCEQHVAVESVVHKNGSVSRNIVLQKVDSSSVTENIFGVNQEAGWRTTMEPVGKNKFDISFTKDFPSVAAINREMNTGDEARFGIRSELTEEFRWFYTYYRYSDTYISVNRMHGVEQEDYFTTEDYLFIDRLPAEGKSISKADSFFLARLNDRIYEDFATRGYYEENFTALLQALDEVGSAPQWKDSLLNRKEGYFKEILKDENFDDENFPLIVEKMGVPVDMIALRKSYKKLIGDFERRMNFMTSAASTRVIHSIQVPWKITATNADSIASDRLIWQPPVARYLLKDYTMYAEGRSFNVWAGVVSVAIIGATFLLFRSKRKRVVSATN